MLFIFPFCFIPHGYTLINFVLPHCAAKFDFLPKSPSRIAKENTAKLIYVYSSKQVILQRFCCMTYPGIQKNLIMN